ncbi:MAG: kelch repeat-containing protein [Verrucomicrobiota bacterium]|jgi:hypothetical protein
MSPSTTRGIQSKHSSCGFASFCREGSFAARVKRWPLPAELECTATGTSHGWQWRRELYLNDSSVWTYDLDQNTWRNLRPLPAPHLAPLRCASWDADEQVVVVFGGEGSQEGTLVYDPYLNEWRWMRPKVQPEFRSGGQMAYDAARKLHVLFGAQFTDDAHT